MAGGISMGLKARVTNLGRDLGVVIDGLRGRRPPPLVTRRRAASAAAPRFGGAAALARALRVVEVFPAARGATGFDLEDPAGTPIDFVPGQFLTLLVPVDGAVHRRAYSVCSACAPPSPRVRLVAKRVEGGRVSNYLGDRLAPGDVLKVLGPSGSFTYAPDPGAARDAVLIGGGSGVTPLMAIALGALTIEPRSRVTLLYGNRAVDDIIFRYELEALARSTDRLTLRHVLSEPPPGWRGGVGRLDRDTVLAELAGLGLPRPGALYYVCGPGPMMDAVRGALLGLGVPRDRVLEELYSRPELRGGATAERPTTPQLVTLRAGGAEHAFTVAPGQYILDAGLSAGAPLRFSCAMGGCAACRVKLRRGRVAMEEPNCLSAAEREAGTVLTCVGWPLEPVIIERTEP